ncbi:hypothetical protein LRS05_00800 [Flavobacterium sp. J372]|uniref:hypothetical protein n=1 Tax=Flavobacterium sp. J372 TaxID=2898436 RepID=UPI002150DD6D|nr:hypothetical protein [Flavobacterium sp. J372]MCR5860775.1 hypothetical protein [Flavobacterium sp. J372]
MLRTSLITILTLIITCCNNVKDLRKDVKHGMHYNEVINMIGKPSDSSAYTNADGNFIRKISYSEVEIFSDYDFYVVFNESLKVIDRGYN